MRPEWPDMRGHLFLFKAPATKFFNSTYKIMNSTARPENLISPDKIIRLKVRFWFLNVDYE